MRLHKKTKHMKRFQNTAFALALLLAFQAQAQQQAPRAKKLPASSSASQQKDPTQEFKKLNKAVKNIRWKEGRILVIEKNDGVIERYQLDNKSEKEKAIQLYGELPVIPPPPPPVAPPPPPAVPAAPADLTLPLPPTAIPHPPLPPDVQ
jgi:hypothetical protein